MPRKKKIRPQIGDRVAALQPNPAGETSSGEAELLKPEPLPQFGLPSAASKYFDFVTRELDDHRNRLVDFDTYETMDANDPEVSGALDVFADSATQVGVTKTDIARGLDNVVQINTPDANLLEFLSEVRNRLKLDERAWALARDLVKMGEVYEEVVVRQNLMLDRLKQLPARTMIRNEDRFGVLHPVKAFLQTSVNDPESVVATFEPWEVVHFRLRTRNEDRYGKSTLHSIRRVFKQLQLIEGSMVVARLTRATSKLVYRIDTGGLPGPQAREVVKSFRDEHRKRRLVDQHGQIRSDVNPIQQDEDVFIGVSKGSQAGVEQLYGDLNIGNLTDVEYLQNKKFAGLRVPKSYLGVERDVSNRSTLTNQDIQFARSVRRLQLAMRIGYHELFDLALILEGSRALANAVAKSRYRVVMPTMQTIDEMREWEIRRIQSEVARISVQELLLDPVEVYTRILGYTDAEAKKLFLGKSSPYAELTQNKNAAKSSTARMDKKFSKQAESLWPSILEAVATEDRSGIQVLRDLRDLCDIRLDELSD